MAVDRIDPRDRESLEAADRARRDQDAALTPAQRIELAADLILQAREFKIQDAEPPHAR